MSKPRFGYFAHGESRRSCSIQVRFETVHSQDFNQATAENAAAEQHAPAEPPVKHKRAYL
jgi:hypothetical protein